jgi:hypothetical protein
MAKPFMDGRERELMERLKAKGFTPEQVKDALRDMGIDPALVEEKPQPPKDSQ